jgi:hypothetical protein
VGEATVTLVKVWQMPASKFNIDVCFNRSMMILRDESSVGQLRQTLVQLRIERVLSCSLIFR